MWISVGQSLMSPMKSIQMFFFTLQNIALGTWHNLRFGNHVFLNLLSYLQVSNEQSFHKSYFTFPKDYMNTSGMQVHGLTQGCQTRSHRGLYRDLFCPCLAQVGVACVGHIQPAGRVFDTPGLTPLKRVICAYLLHWFPNRMVSQK